MYKFVERVEGKFLVVSHLSTNRDDCYRIFVDNSQSDDIEIVQGYGGVPVGLNFTDRLRRQ